MTKYFHIITSIGFIGFAIFQIVNWDVLNLGWMSLIAYYFLFSMIFVIAWIVVRMANRSKHKALSYLSLTSFIISFIAMSLFMKLQVATL